MTKRERDPKVLAWLARQVTLSATGNALLGARAARALGACRLAAPYLSEVSEAERLVAETAEGGGVEAVERIERQGRVEWIATLRDNAGGLFRPGVFGLAPGPSQAVVAAALRRAARMLRMPEAA